MSVHLELASSHARRGLILCGYCWARDDEAWASTLATPPEDRHPALSVALMTAQVAFDAGILHGIEDAAKGEIVEEGGVFLASPRKAPSAHSCLACPVEVRSLYAAAQNASRAWEQAMAGNAEAGDLLRAARVMRELRDELVRFTPLAEAHFAALGMG